MKSKYKSNKTSLIGLGGLMGVTLLSGAVLKSTIVRADVDDEITITVSQSCTMTGSGMTSHTAEIANGQYNSAIGTTNVNVTCNDSAGFAVYAIGYTGNTLGNNKLTSSVLGTAHDIVTGTGLSGNSQWAMKLATVTDPAPTYPIIIAGSTADGDKAQGDPDFSSFQEVPDDYTKVAYRTAGTDVGTNATGANFTTTYQAYISPTQAAGTYTGKVKYVLVHPNTAPAPEKPATFTWQASTATRPADADVKFMMQNFTTAICTAGQNGQIGWVKDSRDNKVYTIAKLADGKCWMVENLDLAGGTALSAADTDITSTYINNFTTSGRLTKENDTIILPASAVKDSHNILTDSTQFSTENYSYVFNSDNKTNCGTDPCYSYYSWDAATLGSGRNISTNDTDADYSICPKGWRLPTSRRTDTFNATIAAESDFYNLATSYGMSTNAYLQSTSSFNTQAGPGTTPNFIYTGYYYNSPFTSGSSGYYWSSTSNSGSDTARGLSFNSNYITTVNTNMRFVGFAVRCLFGN